MKFGFIELVNPNKFYYNDYQDSDFKQKSHFLFKSGYYTTAAKLLILPPIVLILTLSKICGFI